MPHVFWTERGPGGCRSATLPHGRTLATVAAQNSVDCTTPPTYAKPGNVTKAYQGEQGHAYVTRLARPSSCVVL